MQEYHKINGIFVREDERPHMMLRGQYRDPVWKYLEQCEWVFTEKIDGCLAASTRISMADGTTKQLRHVRTGDEVLGVDKDGQIVATPVTNTFNNGAAERWMRVKGTRIGAGRGNSFFSVVCTPNHRFWSPDRNEYVPAEELKVGDTVVVLRSELGLTPIQCSVLLGKLLGDGTLARRHDSRSTAIEFGHRVSDSDYITWTLQALGDLASPSVMQHVSGYGSQMLKGRTVFHPSIGEYFGDFVASGKKRVPEWVADRLDPLALAFWYMDDGSLSTADGQEDRALLSVCGFDEADCAVLQRGLAKLGIGSELMRDGRGYLTLRTNSDDAERLFLLVAPYIPKSMQRKLPKRYRGHVGWLPQDKARTYKPLLTRQIVQELVHDADRVRSSRLDLETGTHNFFANAVLVHNSNVRVHWDGHRVTFGGRTEAASIPAHLYRVLADLFDGSANEQMFEQKFGDAPVTLYGEGYGAKIQKHGEKYKPEPGFMLFDVQIDGLWLERENVEDIARTFDIPVAPIVFEGTLDAAVAFAEAGFNSALAEQERPAEGMVGVPKANLLDRRGRRIIVKLKTRDLQTQIKDAA